MLFAVQLPAGGSGVPSAPYEPTWLDLLDPWGRERIQLVDARQADAAQARESGALTELASLNEFDLIALSGQRIDADTLRTYSSSLAPGGRLAVVVDNALSPLRACDVVRGRPCGDHPVRSLRRVRADIAAAGLVADQVFGLLRSSQVPTTAFDLDRPDAVAAVLRASLTHVGGARGIAVAGLLHTPTRLISFLCPAWLVVARTPQGPLQPDHVTRIVGKISNLDSEEIKLLRGTPVQVLEKHYLNAAGLREADTLAELERAGFRWAPQLISRPRPEVCQFTWLAGRALVASQLDVNELLTWTARASRTLDELHRCTRRDDGSVLVHGDFWLGNLMTSGDHVTGVIDWTDAHRGADDVDRAFLIDSTVRLHPRASNLRHQLVEACRPASSQ